MENIQRKAVRKTIYAFLMFLVLRLLEELVIIPHLRISTKGLVSCVAGIVILLVYIRFDNKALDEIGLLFSARKVGKGLLFAFCLNLFVGAVVFALAYLHLHLSDGTARLNLYYEKPAYSYSSGLRTFLLWMLFALVVAVFHAIFYELSFRGLLLSIGSRSLTFGTVNALQSALYAVWFFIPILRVLIYQTSAMDVKSYLKLAAFTIVYEFITAARLGLLRKATGSLWVCIFDHIAFSFILDTVHLQYTSLTMQVNDDPDYYVMLLGYQVLSLVICYIYSVQKGKAVRQKMQDAALKNEAGF